MGRITRRYDILLTALLFLLAIPAQYHEWFALLEDQTLSFRHQIRLVYGEGRGQVLSHDIVLVNVDETFFKAYKSFPLRRSDIAAIVTNLKALGARVIAVDMLMDFPSSYGEDTILAKALDAAGNTLLVAQAEFKNGRFSGINLPTSLLDEASVSGYTNIQSTNRLVTTLSRLTVHPELTGERGGWPFAVAAAAMYLGVEPKLENRILSLGELRVPLDHRNNLLIDFPPLPTGIRFLSQSAGISALEFLDISALDESERAELEAWVKDRVVLIGDTSEVSHDWFDTPVGMVYGVEIIADTLSTILKGGRLQAVSPEIAAIIPVVLLLAMIALSLLPRPLGRGLCVVGLGSGYVVLATVLYVRQGMVLPVSYVVVAIVLSYLLIEFRQYAVERAQRQRIARTFGQYIPPELVAEMSRSDLDVEIGGESREMTVLFSDVRGFTTISEGLAPQDLVMLMNAFLSPMTSVIHEHRGTIDKYMGDAVMAFWGAPLHDSDHARHAVEAALAMVRKVEALRDDFVARGWRPIKVGIGLNTGTMNVGNMGSDFRVAYTVLGDAVNLGSRVESLTKKYGVDLMVTEYTQNAVPGLISREIDLVRVKGKDMPVRLFEPLGFEEDIDDETRDRLSRHLDALALYRAGKWDAAESAFERLAALEPGRLIYRIHLDRIAYFKHTPPADGWDGVYTHQEK
ncbi:adenylate/guanylate cyclase domain-containing protein [Magnetospirillum molischianum]|uniref:Adenylate cyclase n=1 Tax=Magnetospirillum molischianum DSM 120 TaxID=1150626 RepID=H8FV85_MAGML|nr:adenylate/guanylate cyclase domain-containing protein [Magnetospirillum molischianum]CCG42273.1 Adenylate cyclase [Magnetospirillum molischianum DSM 120]